VEWLGTIDALLELKLREGLDVVIIDPLAVFTPGKDEGTPAGIMEYLMPLRKLTDEGIAILLAHHPRKGKIRAGQAARGSGALAGYADILIEKDWYGRPDGTDRRRRLTSYSRLSETPRSLAVELNDAGDDYSVCPPEEEPEGQTSECSDVLG